MRACFCMLYMNNYGYSYISLMPLSFETHPPRVKKKKKKEEDFRLDSNDFGFICTGVNFFGGYK